MAIDTLERRQAVAGMREGFHRVFLNVAKDAEWRQEVAGLYPGIASTGGEEEEEPVADNERWLLLLILNMVTR